MPDYTRDQIREVPDWGTHRCPVCGREITNNARGRASHMRSCIKKRREHLAKKEKKQ